MQADKHATCAHALKAADAAYRLTDAAYRPTDAAYRPTDTAYRPTDTAYRLMGLTIIALVPALFWTGVLAAVGTAIGHPLSTAALATVGAAIATFLVTAVSALFARIG
jgi:hypothetical protein